MQGHFASRAGQTQAGSSPETEASTPAEGVGHLSDLAQTLAAHTQGVSAAELALDLVLHEIVEQARLATTASGAAIALVRDHELACRASSGPNAPDLGVRLTTHSGLSAACVRTLEPQRCDDTQTDSRVDAESCQRHDIRSVLVAPVMEGGSLAGILAIFGDRTYAFGERDVQTLEAFSGRIVQSIRHAADVMERASGAATPVLTQSVQPSDTAVRGPAPDGEERVKPPHDYWSDVLSAMIVALALLLGWMIGRAGWHSAFSNKKPIPLTTTAPRVSANPAPQPAPSAQAVGPDLGLSLRTKKNPERDANSPPAGGMVVYQDGKVIFEMTPAGLIPGKSGEASTPASSLLSEQATTAPLTIPQEVAEALLIHRVEPQYPDEAKQSGVQGSVILEASISRDGTVQRLTSLSGDRQLAAAAMDAARQWRFKPYMRNGQPVEVQTQIKLQFVLP